MDIYLDIDGVLLSTKSPEKDILKTEGIDMDQDFVWFDDELFEAERWTLEVYHALDGYYRIDPKNLRSAKKALKNLKSI